MMLRAPLALACMGLAIIVGVRAFGAGPRQEPRIGFVTKMPEQAWFLSEAKAARAVGAARGYTVVTLGAPDGERLMTAIDNLATQGARGLVVCAPDVRLGPAVRHRAAVLGLKLLTVDDRFLGPDGRPLLDVPHLGMSGRKIGEQVGATVIEEMRRRGWNPTTVGVLRMTSQELPTAVERVEGATAALVAGGVARDRMFDAPLKATDTESANTASGPVLSRHDEIKRWAIVSVNEETVLGGVRATEQFGLPAADVIGVGIGGAGAAIAELSKAGPTGFYATIAVSSIGHGRRTTEALIDWIEHGRRPPADTATTGTVMTRANWRAVQAALDRG